MVTSDSKSRETNHKYTQTQIHTQLTIIRVETE